MAFEELHKVSGFVKTERFGNQCNGHGRTYQQPFGFKIDPRGDNIFRGYASYLECGSRQAFL